MELLKRLVMEEEGQGLVEYALIIALIALVVIGVVALLGKQITEVFTSITEKLADEGITGE